MHFIPSETMARKTGPTDRQLAFLDPLLCRPSLVIEPYDRPARKLQVGECALDSESSPKCAALGRRWGARRRDAGGHLAAAGGHVGEARRAQPGEKAREPPAE